MYLRIISLSVAGVLAAADVYSDSGLPQRNNYVRIETLSGVEAEVIRNAMDSFIAKGLNITPYGYDVSIYLNNDDYIVFFERAKDAAPGTIDPGYEVVISGKTLKVIHTQFSK
jgi:hypothetical protein